MNKERCSGRTKPDSWGHTAPCLRSPTITEDDKPYCYVHAPSRVAQRRAERDAAWDAERKRESAEAARQARQLAEEQRKLAAFDSLLVACKEAETFVNQLSMGRTDAGLAIRLRKAIEKAQG